MKIKCPYCGYESTELICEHCKAAIPKKDEKSSRNRGKEKELKENGT